MPAPSSFDYATIRLVPRVEREEFINVGVILFCRTRRFLDARIALDEARLAALAPACDPATVRPHLALIPRLCRGEVASDPTHGWTLAERFHWLTAPRSAIIQFSPVHSGLCHDPAAALDRLLARMVGNG